MYLVLDTSISSGFLTIGVDCVLSTNGFADDISGSERRSHTMKQSDRHLSYQQRNRSKVESSVIMVKKWFAKVDWEGSFVQMWKG